MELVKGGQLKDFVEARYAKDEAFSDEEASTMIKSILSAISHLHAKEIVHRDLKPENILVKDWKDLSSVKIADFGLSGQFGAEGFMKTFRQKCGTMIYMAPELASNMLYSKPVDIWSCGLIMYMLLSKGNHPLYEKKDTPESYLKKLNNLKWTFGDNFTPIAQNFFLKLMNPDPLIRYTAEDALKHPWITRNFDDEIPLGAHEVVTYFSMEQTFTRILKALYLTSHLGSLKGETMSMPTNDYKDLVGKMFNDNQGNQPKKAPMGRKSFLLEYDSLQSLLGISLAAEHTLKKSSFFSSYGGGQTDSNNDSGKSSPNNLNKFPSEETKAQEPKDEEEPKLKIHKVDSEEIPKLFITKEQGEPVRKQFLKPFEMPYQHNSLDLNKTTNDTIKDRVEESILNLPAELESVDSTSDISMIPKSAREQNKHDITLKESSEEHGNQSDNAISPQKNQSKRVLKQHKGSVPGLAASKLDTLDNFSYVSDDSSEGSVDSTRSMPLKGELQKMAKKSPFFHNAQKSNGPMATPGSMAGKNFSVLLKSSSNGGLLPNIQRKSRDTVLPQIVSPKNYDVGRKGHEKQFPTNSFRSNSKPHFTPTAAPMASQTTRPLFDLPEAKYFTPKNGSSSKKSLDLVQNLRSVVGSNNKESVQVSKSKKSLTLKTDNSATDFF